MKLINLLDQGFSLVPIPRGQKGPVSADWNLQRQCINSVNDALKLEGMNVGLAHAYCTPTPTCAIDIDNYRPAKPWLATHGIDLDSKLFDPKAVVIWSGKKNSLKLLYRLPHDTPALESKKIAGADGKCMLEFRCATKEGKTVQDLLPPSIHPEGHQYQWVGQGNPLHLPVLPEEMLQLWHLTITNGSRVANRKFDATSGHRSLMESPRQIATITDALQHINADCHRDMWRDVVWAVLSTGWTCAEELAQTWSKSAPHRYEEESFWLVVSSYMPDHKNPITVGTIYHHARKGGWNG